MANFLEDAKGSLLCKMGKHDIITYYPTGQNRSSYTRVKMCSRCLKEFERKTLTK